MHVLGRSLFYTWGKLPTSLTRNGSSGNLLHCMVFHRFAFSADAFWVARESYHRRFRIQLLRLLALRFPKNLEILRLTLFFHFFFLHNFNCYTRHTAKFLMSLIHFKLPNLPYYTQKFSYQRAGLELANLAIMFLADF